MSPTVLCTDLHSQVENGLLLSANNYDLITCKAQTNHII